MPGGNRTLFAREVVVKAEQEDRTVAQTIRRALREYLDRHKR